MIAVDVMARPPVLRRGARPPGIVETLARATVLGSARWVDTHRDRADMVIAPDTGDISLMEFTALDRAVGAGRRAALASLDAIKAALSPG